MYFFSMDLPQETIEHLWEKLKISDYPNINKMDELDVRRIFEKDNRIKFLTWAFIKLIPSYEYRLESAKHTHKLESTIGNLLHSNGFCLASEQNNFLTRTFKDKNQEITILNRIFKSLSAGHESEDKENLDSETQQLIYVLDHPTNQLINQRFLCNENIFPDEDHHKNMSQKERLNKIKSYKETLKNVETEIQSAEEKRLQLISELKGMKDYNDITKEEIDDIMKKFSEHTTIFENNFPEYSARFPEKTVKPTDSNIGPMFEKINENVNYALKVIYF